MDVNGRIRIVGRTKEIIIRGGANIYPREIEEIVITHPLIHSAAVSFENLFFYFYLFNAN
jgi:acyl-CoA synthetase (AMP-forming)/AMP-acid ligase II